ncbi:MAG: peptide deformylase [Eubacteriales bacterium]|nr:peptide deformylase [Eubacteriales bacterium]
MIRPICRDTFFLSRKALPATRADLAVAVDLADTLRAHAQHCVGMAANMIGEDCRIIAFLAGPACVVMLNPVIVERRGAYDAQEGCLSLEGERAAKRWRDIVVEYDDERFVHRRQRFSGFPAQIIQHEVDHCEGILI